MTYLQPRRHKSKHLNVFLIGGVLVVLFLSLLMFFQQPMRSVFQSLLAPVWLLEQRVFGESGFLMTVLSSKQSLQDENTNLKLLLVEARKETALVRELYRQNTSLKEILGRSNDRPAILAAVIARPPRLVYDTLMVDAGAELGVTVGDRVYVLGNIVIGEVTAVYSSTSLVTLYSTSGYETDVLVDGISALARGRGGGNYVVELPRDLVIATGTSVTLPGASISLFGVVESVIAHPADPVQQLYFRNPYTLSTLTFVSLEKRALGADVPLEDSQSVELP